MEKKKKDLWIFSIASFLNDVGSDMVNAVWPIFVTSVLGANMAVLGLLDGLGEVLVSISGAVSGYLSDKFGKRKAFIWLGYLLSSIARVGYALSRSAIHLVPFKALDRLGKIRGPPRDAMIADAQKYKERGGAFGLLRAMDNLGAFVGIVLAILLIQHVGYVNLFLLAALPSLAAAALIMLAIKENKGRVKKVKMSLSKFDNNFRLFLVVSGIFALAAFSYSFFIVFANQLGYSYYIVPIFYLIFALSASVFSIPLGMLSDRIGRRKVIAIAYMSFAVICIGFTFAMDIYLVILLFVLYGVHATAYETSRRAIVSDLCPKEVRASALGVSGMVVGLLALPASLIAGLLWDNLGMHVPLYFSAGLAIVATSLLAFVKEGK